MKKKEYRKRGSDNHISNNQLIQFYDKLIREGIISKGGPAYKRWQELNGITEKHRKNRIKEFLEKKNARL